LEHGVQNECIRIRIRTNALLVGVSSYIRGFLAAAVAFYDSERGGLCFAFIFLKKETKRFKCCFSIFKQL